MIKHAQTIRRLLPTIWVCFTILWGWPLKGELWYITLTSETNMILESNDFMRNSSKKIKFF